MVCAHNYIQVTDNVNIRFTFILNYWDIEPAMNITIQGKCAYLLRPVEAHLHVNHFLVKWMKTSIDFKCMF